MFSILSWLKIRKYLFQNSIDSIRYSFNYDIVEFFHSITCKKFYDLLFTETTYTSSRYICFRSWANNEYCDWCCLHPLIIFERIIIFIKCIWFIIRRMITIFISTLFVFTLMNKRHHKTITCIYAILNEGWEGGVKIIVDVIVGGRCCIYSICICTP